MFGISEDLIGLLVIAIIGLSQWLTSQRARKKSREALNRRTVRRDPPNQSAPTHQPTPQRAPEPELESDPEQEMRDFLRSVGIELPAPPRQQTPTPQQHKPQPEQRQKQPVQKKATPRSEPATATASAPVSTPDSLAAQAAYFVSDPVTRPATAQEKSEASDPWNLQPLLNSRDDLRRAFILSEILGPPKALSSSRNQNSF